MTKSGCEVLRCQKFIGGVCTEKGEYKDSETGEPCCSHRRNAVHVSPAPDPRDALIEQMGEALKRSKWTLEKFKDDKNDDSVSPTATATIPQDEPYIHLNMVESALAAWEKYKEAQ